MAQLVQLQQMQSKLQALGVKTYAISGSTLVADRHLVRQNGITLPIIWDRQFRIGRRYGVYGGPQMPMDVHAIFVVNGHGQVIFAARPTDMKVSRSAIWHAAQQAARS